MTNLDSILKSSSITLLKGLSCQSHGIPEVTYGCESWTIKKAEGQRIDAFVLWCWRRLLRVLWTSRRSNQSILKEISPAWIFIGRTDAEAKAPILWPPDAKNWLIGKDSDAGQDWKQEEQGMTGNEMVESHHRLRGRGFEPAPGAGDGQGSLVCCSPWVCRVGQEWVTELNWTD